MSSTLNSADQQTAAAETAEAPPAVVSDGELLRTFLSSGDEGAFRQLVVRHTPMVYSVCVSVLRNAADAEDAFQAAFFVLARRSRGIQQRNDISAWLHKVALRCALTARRRKQPQSSVPLPPADELPKHELEKISTRASMTLLHEQLDLLPVRYRTPLILYYLQGATREETRARLGLSEAALKSRLERGKRMLRRRLTQAGFAALGLGVLLQSATSVSGQVVSPALQQSTIAIALQVKQAWAAAIQSAGANSAIPVAQGVQRTMMLSSLLKSASVVVVGFGLGLAAMAPFSDAAVVFDSAAQEVAQLSDAKQDPGQEDQAKEVEVAVNSNPQQEPAQDPVQAKSQRRASVEAVAQEPLYRELEVPVDPLYAELEVPLQGQEKQRFLYQEPIEYELRWDRARGAESGVWEMRTTVSDLQARVRQLEREVELYRRLYELERENAKLRQMVQQANKK